MIESIGPAIAAGIDRAASCVRQKPGDYEQDGIVYCGSCHTPKQACVNWLPDENGNPQTRIVPVMCKCERDAEEAERKRRDEDQFDYALKTMRKDVSALSLPHTFADDDGSNPAMLSMCKQYVEKWREMRQDNMGILLYGSNGTGKSFYASCIVNALAEQRAATTGFVTAASLIGALEDMGDRANVIDTLCHFGLLCIDDLGSERESSYASELLYAAIDARYRSKRPTIVTTNFDIASMEKTDNIWRKRIFERVTEMCPIAVRMDGESKRKTIADERRNKARDILRKAAVSTNGD